MKLSIKQIRLGSAWLLAPLYVIFAEPTPTALAIGAVPAVIGLVIRGWAAGTIHKNRVLTTGGPYAYTRNPLYLGTFFMALGLGIASGSWVLLALIAILFLAIYGATMRHEARNLERWFPDDYRRYADAVPLFLPRPTAYQPAEPHPTQFDIQRYVRNGEYQAAVGMAVGFLALALKLYL